MNCCNKCVDFAFGLDTACRKDDRPCHTQGMREKVCLCGQEIMGVQEPAVHTDTYCGPLQDLIQKEIILAVEKEREKYNELILAVENKYPNETRHETALRIIKNSQRGSETTSANPK